jgi:lysophospholipase L1-like esterase
VNRKIFRANVFKNVSLFIVFFFITFLIIEIFVRFTFPSWAPRTGVITNFWRFDPAYGWSHVPDTKGYFSSYGFNTNVEINPHGFRQREIPYKRNRMLCRILVVGDSYVWGYGVEQKEIFTSRMEEINPKLEVVNIGVSGYSTDQELLLFRDKGIKYQPDIVILVVSNNDFKDNLLERVYITYNKPVFKVGDNNKLILTNVPVPQRSLMSRSIAYVAARSYILTQLNRILDNSNVLQLIRAQFKEQSKEQPSEARQSLRANYLRKNELIMALLLSEFQKTVSEIGSELLVVFTRGVGRKGYRIADYLDNTGIHFMHLDKIMKENIKELLLEKNFHWNDKGHFKVAQAILEELKRFSLHRVSM